MQWHIIAVERHITKPNLTLVSAVEIVLLFKDPFFVCKSFFYFGGMVLLSC